MLSHLWAFASAFPYSHLSKSCADLKSHYYCLDAFPYLPPHTNQKQMSPLKPSNSLLEKITQSVFELPVYLFYLP